PANGAAQHLPHRRGCQCGQDRTRLLCPSLSPETDQRIPHAEPHPSDLTQWINRAPSAKSAFHRRRILRDAAPPFFRRSLGAGAAFFGATDGFLATIILCSGGAVLKGVEFYGETFRFPVCFTRGIQVKPAPQLRHPHLSE